MGLVDIWRKTRWFCLGGTVVPDKFLGPAGQFCHVGHGAARGGHRRHLQLARSQAVGTSECTLTMMMMNAGINPVRQRPSLRVLLSVAVMLGSPVPSLVSPPSILLLVASHSRAFRAASLLKGLVARARTLHEVFSRQCGSVMLRAATLYTPCGIPEETRYGFR